MVKLSSMAITFSPPVTDPIRCVNITFEEGDFEEMEHYFLVIFIPSNDSDVFAGSNVANVTVTVSDEGNNYTAC